MEMMVLVLRGKVGENEDRACKGSKSKAKVGVSVGRNKDKASGRRCAAMLRDEAAGTYMIECRLSSLIAMTFFFNREAYKHRADCK